MRLMSFQSWLSDEDLVRHFEKLKTDLARLSLTGADSVSIGFAKAFVSDVEYEMEVRGITYDQVPNKRTQPLPSDEAA